MMNETTPHIHLIPPKKKEEEKKENQPPQQDDFVQLPGTHRLPPDQR